MSFLLSILGKLISGFFILVIGLGFILYFLSTFLWIMKGCKCEGKNPDLH